MSSYVDTWDALIKNPPPTFINLFKKEKDYLQNHIKASASVLDIGCGNGRNILSFIDSAGAVTGLDNSEKAVEDARKNLEAYPNVEIVLGDAFNLPFNDKSFDYAVLSMTLVNFADGKVKALEEMKRVVKDDGKIIISVYSEKALPERVMMYNQVGAKIKSENKGYVVFENEGLTSEQFSRAEIEDLANKAGLKIKDCEEVGSLAYICTLEKYAQFLAI